MKFPLPRALSKIFLAAALAGGVASGVQAAEPQPPAPATAPVSSDRSLSFKIAIGVKEDGSIVYAGDKTHTVTYFSGGKLEMSEINALLQDRDAGVEAPKGMDPELMDLLFALKGRLEIMRPGAPVVFHVISGYRSPATNETLRTDPANPYGGAVAKNSEHMRAKAVDIFVPGFSGEELRDAAWSLQKGGVGYYPQFREIFPQGYIHVDTGRVRQWGVNQ